MKNDLSLKFAIPKGRMQDGVVKLLEEAGIHLSTGSRAYRPVLNLTGFETKILKPQNIVEMLALGLRDLGFAGADWVHEFDADIVELLDTKLDPVRVVAAVPPNVLIQGRLPSRSLVIASEYEQLASRWIRKQNLTATIIRSFGATEVFPPEDADCIIDNTASGATLRDNNLVIYDELMTSSTVLYASKQAMADQKKRAKIEDFVLLVKSVLEARTRVMLELNVSEQNMTAVIEILPCMKEPTISVLHANAGFAVKAAVPRKDLPLLIPAIKSRGGTDIVITKLTQIIP